MKHNTLYNFGKLCPLEAVIFLDKSICILFGPTCFLKKKGCRSIILIVYYNLCFISVMKAFSSYGFFSWLTKNVLVFRYNFKLFIIFVNTNILKYGKYSNTCNKNATPLAPRGMSLMKKYCKTVISERDNCARAAPSHRRGWRQVSINYIPPHLAHVKCTTIWC